MPIHLQRDLDHLRRELLFLGGLVESQVQRALTGLVDRRLDQLEKVLAGDEEVDRREVYVEECALKALALHQPVANDLRFIVAVMMVNADLERMGDLAVNVAERASYVVQRPPLDLDLDFPGMGKEVRSMLRGCLDAFVNLDLDLARRVLANDDEVDRRTRELIETLEDHLEAHPEAVRRGLHLVSAVRHLERIGDLSTNVAEEVIFLIEGEVVRHRIEDYVAQEERRRQSR